MRRLGRCVAPATAGLLTVFGLTLALGGCATSSGESTPVSKPLARADTGVEDDGLPAQVPPPAAIRQAPDDPSEPYSRNYGPSSPRRPGPSVRLSEAEADALMARAIAAHEMRRP